MPPLLRSACLASCSALVVGISLGVAPVLAWDGITPAPVQITAGGLALSPILGWSSGRPQWIDAAGRMLGLPQVMPSGAEVLTTEPPRCW